MSTESQVDKLIAATQIIHDVANGADDETVATESGDVVTVANAMKAMTTYNPTGEWTTGTDYSIKDLFTHGTDDTIYMTVVDHTSGVFQTDFDDGKIAIYQSIDSSAEAQAYAADALASKNAAETAETNASNSASAAATSASNASTSETNASNSASSASSSASSASTSASNASTSETNASNSASAAATSASNAALYDPVWGSWQDASYEYNWLSGGNPTWSSHSDGNGGLQYRKSADNKNIQFRGYIARNTSAGINVCQLTGDYIPSYNSTQYVRATVGGQEVVDISTSGYFRVFNPGTGGEFYINCIFPLD